MLRFWVYLAKSSIGYVRAVHDLQARKRAPRIRRKEKQQPRHLLLLLPPPPLLTPVAAAEAGPPRIQFVSKYIIIFVCREKKEFS